MSDNDTELRTIIIPVNVTQSKRILGFRIRNIAEGVISGAFVGFLIHFIPFVPKVQIIVTAVLAGAVLVLNMLGLKGMSISECVINIFLSKNYKKKYHLRSIRYAKKASALKTKTNTTANFNESIAEKLFRKAKEAIQERKQ